LWVTVYQTTWHHIPEDGNLYVEFTFEKPIKRTREKRVREISVQKFTNEEILPLNFQWELH
jgi:hypothetical protein